MKKLALILILGTVLFIPACNQNDDLPEPTVPEDQILTEEEDDDVNGPKNGG